MAEKITRGMRNHNPLNIRRTKDDWQGLKVIWTDKEFCEFSCDFYGFRAAFRILLNYFKRGLDTVSKIIRTWAPSTENPTETYIKFVCNSIGVHEHELLDISNRGVMCHLVLAMSFFESGRKVEYNIVIIENAYDSVFNV